MGENESQTRVLEGVVWLLSVIKMKYLCLGFLDFIRCQCGCPWNPALLLELIIRKLLCSIIQCILSIVHYLHLIFKFIFYLNVYLHVCMRIRYIQMHTANRRGYQSSWSWSFRLLWTALCGCWESGRLWSPGRAISILNHWPILPLFIVLSTLSLFFLMETQISWGLLERCVSQEAIVFWSQWWFNFTDMDLALWPTT